MKLVTLNSLQTDRQSKPSQQATLRILIAMNLPEKGRTLTPKIETN